MNQGIRGEVNKSGSFYLMLCAVYNTCVCNDHLAMFVVDDVPACSRRRPVCAMAVSRPEDGALDIWTHNLSHEFVV